MAFCPAVPFGPKANHTASIAATRTTAAQTMISVFFFCADMFQFLLKAKIKSRASRTGSAAFLTKQTRTIHPS